MFPAFLCLALCAAPAFAEELCFDVEQNSQEMVELMKEHYVVRGEKMEARSYEFVGVGVQIDSSAKVIGIIPESPAAQAGVPVGAQIVAVDDIPLAGLGGILARFTAEFIKGRGVAGSVVRLVVELQDGSRNTYALTRANLVADKEVIVLSMCKPAPAESSDK